MPARAVRSARFAFGYQGPFRLLSPNDKTGSRSVRMLESIDVVRKLSAQNHADLIEFLRSLTDQAVLHDPRFADPWRGQ